MRSADRRRRAARAARVELAELPPEMARLRLVREDVVRKAKLQVLFDDAYTRVSEASPVDARGELKESFKRLIETADRLHTWTTDLLRAFPVAQVAPAPENRTYDAVFEDGEPALAEMAAALPPVRASRLLSDHGDGGDEVRRAHGDGGAGDDLHHDGPQARATGPVRGDRALPPAPARAALPGPGVERPDAESTAMVLARPPIANRSRIG